MTFYHCDNCGRHKHISKLGEFIRIIDIGLVSINKTILLCKWCLTKAKINYKVIDGWVDIDDSIKTNKEKKQ